MGSIKVVFIITSNSKQSKKTVTLKTIESEVVALLTTIMQ